MLSFLFIVLNSFRRPILAQRLLHSQSANVLTKIMPNEQETANIDKITAILSAAIGN